MYLIFYVLKLYIFLADKYFVPVIAYLIFSTFDYIGRVLAGSLLWVSYFSTVFKCHRRSADFRFFLLLTVLKFSAQAKSTCFGFTLCG